jgi:hypothetical protein
MRAPLVDLTLHLNTRQRTVTLADMRRIALILYLVLTFVLPRPVFAQDGEAAMLLQKINALRTSKGLPALAYNGVLAAAANAHSVYLSTHVWTDAHTEINGSTPHSRAIAAGYPVKYVGENVVGGMNATVDWAFNWWLNSPIHYQNMLGQLYTEIGIGVADGSNGKFYTLLFGTPDGANPPPPQNPAPEAPVQPTTEPAADGAQNPAPTNPPRPTRIATQRPTSTPTATFTPTITYTPRATFTPTFTASPLPPSITPIVMEVSPQPTDGPQLVAVVSTPAAGANTGNSNSAPNSMPSKPNDWLRTLIPFAIMAQVVVAGGFAVNSAIRRRHKR